MPKRFDRDMEQGDDPKRDEPKGGKHGGKHQPESVSIVGRSYGKEYDLLFPHVQRIAIAILDFDVTKLSIAYSSLCSAATQMVNEKRDFKQVMSKTLSLFLPPMFKYALSLSERIDGMRKFISELTTEKFEKESASDSDSDCVRVIDTMLCDKTDKGTMKFQYRYFTFVFSEEQKETFKTILRQVIVFGDSIFSFDAENVRKCFSTFSKDKSIVAADKLFVCKMLKVVFTTFAVQKKLEHRYNMLGRTKTSTSQIPTSDATRVAEQAKKLKSVKEEVTPVKEEVTPVKEEKKEEEENKEEEEEENKEKDN